MRFLRSLQLVSLSDVVSGLIEELCNQAIEFLLAIKLDGGICQCPRGKILPQLVLGDNESPEDFAEMDSLAKPAFAEIGVTGLNGKVGLLEEPLPKVVVDLVNAGIQLVERQPAIRRSTRTALQLQNDSTSKFFSVTLK